MYFLEPTHSFNLRPGPAVSSIKSYCDWGKKLSRFVVHIINQTHFTKATSMDHVTTIMHVYISWLKLFFLYLSFSLEMTTRQKKRQGEEEKRNMECDLRIRQHKNLGSNVVDRTTN